MKEDIKKILKIIMIIVFVFAQCFFAWQYFVNGIDISNFQALIMIILYHQYHERN